MFHIHTYILPPIFLIAVAFELSIRDEECREQGLHCSVDCNEIILCTAAGDSPVVIETCSTGTFCNPDNFTCTASECSTPAGSVTCFGTGIFPDPYDCSLSYSCLTVGVPPDLKCECESGVFDPNTLTCKDSLDCCRTYNVKCNAPGEAFSFGPNCDPGYYYVCGLCDGVMRANVVMCPVGFIFSDIYKTCVRGSRHYQGETNEISKIDNVCRGYNVSEF